MTDPADLAGRLDFLRQAERMKDALRSGYTSGGRQESVADHTWRLCVMALVLSDLFPDVDPARLMQMCLVHDLGEAIGGDIPAPEQTAGGAKAEQEREDLLTITSALPARVRDGIVALWDEYEAAATTEARLAKALDKLETILQHTQGANPPNFDHRFNLEYGRRHTKGDPTVVAIRAVLDVETERCAEEADRRGECQETVSSGTARPEAFRAPGDVAADAYMSEPVRFGPLHVVDLAAEAAAVTELYRNEVMSRVNDTCLRLAVFDGPYRWHRHPTSDELFIVVEGELAIDLDDGTELRLRPWQAVTVPAGTVHRTRAIGRTVNLCVEALAAETEFIEPECDTPTASA